MTLPIHTISNGLLSVGIKTKGAELASIKAVDTNLEYMWQALPPHWGRHSSILFPIIGSIKENAYTVDGQVFTLKRHGFVRNADFEVAQQSEDSITFSLIQTAATRAAYPFEYTFKAKYSLEGQSVSIAYIVENLSDNIQYFSLGGHPAFNVPLHAGEKRSDYSLWFDQPEIAFTQLLNAEGIRDGRTRLVLNRERQLVITNHLFDHDALILSNLNSSKVSLLHHKSGKKVFTFHFDGFPYLGIWSSSREAPFVCIEPWHGVADAATHNHNFIQKEGIVALGGNEVFECVHRVEIH